MGYPVSYRERGGRELYQPGPAPGGGSQKPPAPANDNWPMPANDNQRPVELPPKYEGALNNASKALNLAKVAARVLNKRVPALQVASAAIDIIRWIDDQHDQNRAPGAIPWTKGSVRINGFTVSSQCGRRPELFYSNLGYPNCGFTDLVLKSSSWDVNPMTNTISAFQFTRYWVDGVTNRGDPACSYTRNAGNTNPVTVADKVLAPGVPLPVVKPIYPAWVDPWFLPINVPVPRPAPMPYSLIPYRQADPMRSETFSSKRGYPPPLPKPDPPRRRPEGGTKEKKVRGVSGIVASIQAGAHTLSEANDLADAIWTALPSQYRTKGKPSTQQKAIDIYNGWQHIDINKAVQNIIVNQVIDAAIGKSSGAVDSWLKTRVAPFTGNPLGVTIGSAF